MDFTNTKVWAWLFGATAMFAASGTLFAVPTLTLTLSAPGSSAATCTSGTTNTFSGGICTSTVSTTNPPNTTLTFSGQVGNWTTNVTSGADLGDILNPFDDLGSIDASSKVGLPGTLKVIFSETGFVGVPFLVTNFDDSINSTTSAGVVFEDLYGTGPLSTWTVIPGSLSPSLSSGSYGGTATISTPNPYGIAIVALITGSSTKLSLASIDADIQGTAPEPGMYGILAIGLMGLFVVVRRRKHSEA